MFVVSVVFCHVEVSATSWLLIQRSPTDCGTSSCLISKPRERGGPGPLGAVAPKTNTANKGRTSRPGSIIHVDEAELKVSDVWDVRACRLVKVYRRFRGTKFYMEGPQILGAPVQNVAPWATWHPEFVHLEGGVLQTTFHNLHFCASLNRHTPYIRPFS